MTDYVNDKLAQNRFGFRLHMCVCDDLPSKKDFWLNKLVTVMIDAGYCYFSGITHERTNTMNIKTREENTKLLNNSFSCKNIQSVEHNYTFEKGKIVFCWSYSNSCSYYSCGLNKPQI